MCRFLIHFGLCLEILKMNYQDTLRTTSFKKSARHTHEVRLDYIGTVIGWTGRHLFYTFQNTAHFQDLVFKPVHRCHLPVQYLTRIRAENTIRQRWSIFLSTQSLTTFKPVFFFQQSNHLLVGVGNMAKTSEVRRCTATLGKRIKPCHNKPHILHAFTMQPVICLWSHQLNLTFDYFRPECTHTMFFSLLNQKL
jgi:hypothetical protein